MPTISRNWISCPSHIVLLDHPDSLSNLTSLSSKHEDDRRHESAPWRWNVLHLSPCGMMPSSVPTKRSSRPDLHQVVPRTPPSAASLCQWELVMKAHAFLVVPPYAAAFDFPPASLPSLAIALPSSKAPVCSSPHPSMTAPPAVEWSPQRRDPSQTRETQRWEAVDDAHSF